MAVPSALRPPAARSARPAIVPLLCALVAGGVTLTSFALERFTLAGLVVTLAAGAGLALSTGWWYTHRRAVLAAALDVLLVFAYLWSLDDSIQVEIDAGPGGVVAHVGSDVARLNAAYHPGGIALAAGDMSTYRVGTTGESFDFADYNQRSDEGGYLQPVDSPLSRFENAVRLATPLPAWGRIRLSAGGRAIPLTAPLSTSGWSRNVRGEWQGRPGATGIIAAPVSGRFRFSADLLRGDGTQGIVIGLTNGTGSMFAVRLDQPDALWFPFNRGELGDPVGGTALHPSVMETIRRDLRLLLANVIAALLLLLLVPLAALLLAGLGRVSGETANADVDALVRVLTPRRTLVAACAAAGAALAATALIATDLLQQIPHVQDSVAYLFQAQTLALGHLSLPAPRLPAFFSEEFIPLHDGRWFGKYPPGWPILLAAGVLAHAPWLIDPILSAADLLLIYLIGREVYDHRVALLGAVLNLTSPFFLFLGGSFMAHTATLFYLAGFAWLVIRWTRRQEQTPARRDVLLLFLAGFLLGMGALTRQLDAIAFAAPFLGLLLVPAVRRQWRQLPLIAAGAIIPGIALLLYNRALTGSAWVSPYSLWWSFDRPGFGRSVGMTGFTFAQGLWNTSFNLEMLLAHLFGWPFYFTLALAAIPFLLGRATRWDLLFAASAAAVIVAYVFYWAPGVMYGPRYYFVALPWFAPLSARGLQELAHLAGRLRGVDRTAALLASGMLLALLLACDLGVYLPAQLPVYRGYNFVNGASLAAVKQAGIHHAVVFVVDNPPGTWWSYGEVFSANTPALNGDVVFARDRGAADTQLMRLYPGRRAYRLDYTTLTPLPHDNGATPASTR